MASVINVVKNFPSQMILTKKGTNLQQRTFLQYLATSGKTAQRQRYNLVALSQAKLLSSEEIYFILVQ